MGNKVNADVIRVGTIQSSGNGVKSVRCGAIKNRLKIIQNNDPAFWGNRKLDLTYCKLLGLMPHMLST